MTPAEIAAGLSEAQKRVLCRIVDAGSIPYGLTPSELRTNGRTMEALWEKGLTCGGRVYGGVRSYIAEPLGLEVRAIIEKENSRAE